MAPSAIQISPLTYQSADISLSDWISLLTLCLAPLLAHVVAGAPRPTYLSRARPAWHERIGHFNPTSILWRYAAIADRRLRARAWGPADMAATNAVFHSPAGWDGSEVAAVYNMPRLCAELPGRARVALLSGTTLQTLIVTLQGIQALVHIAQITFSEQALCPAFPLDSLFSLIAIVGLLRLYAALWLTNDFAYTASDNDDVTAEPSSPPAIPLGRSKSDVTVRTLESTSHAGSDWALAQLRFRPSSCRRSRVFRSVFVVNIFAIWAIACLNLIPGTAGYQRIYTATSFLFAIVSIVFLSTTLAVFVYYSARCGFNSTIIPCIVSTWYKIYTALFFALALALAVVSAIETRRTPCGRYTTKSRSSDSLFCPGLVYVEPGLDSVAFGLATTMSAAYEPRVPDESQFVVIEFSGSCLGVGGPVQGAMYANVSSSN